MSLHPFHRRASPSLLPAGQRRWSPVRAEVVTEAPWYERYRLIIYKAKLGYAFEVILIYEKIEGIYMNCNILVQQPHGPCGDRS